MPFDIARVEALQKLGGDAVWIREPSRLTDQGPIIAYQLDSGDASHDMQTAGPSSLPASPSSKRLSYDAIRTPLGLSPLRHANGIGPPCAYRDPKAAALPRDHLNKRRPLSAEFIGTKAKDAFADLGRAAKEIPRGLYRSRNASKAEINDLRGESSTASKAAPPLGGASVTVDSLFAPAGAGLGLEGLQATHTVQSPLQEGNRRQFPTAKDENDDKAKTSEKRSSSSKFKISGLELSLEDVESDSPIFRAALSGLERRTGLLKKAAKGLIRAASDKVSALQALEISESQLSQAYSNLSDILPATCGVIQTQMLAGAQEAETAKRSEQLMKLEMHIIRPMNALAEMCRELSRQLKAFDTESKAYYGATQKWLSTQATPLPGNPSSPDMQGKQERQDAKQQLRQASFDLARVELYQSICALHSGEMELLIATHLLRHDEAQTSHSLSHAFELTKQKQLERIHHLSETVLARCSVLSSRVEELQYILQIGKLDTDDPFRIAHIAHSDDRKSRNEHNVWHTGNKVRELLALVRSGPSSQTSMHPQAGNERHLESSTSPDPRLHSSEQALEMTSQPLAHVAANHPVFGSSTTSETTAPNGTKWSSRLRTFSFSKQVSSPVRKGFMSAETSPPPLDTNTDMLTTVTTHEQCRQPEVQTNGSPKRLVSRPEITNSSQGGVLVAGSSVGSPSAAVLNSQTFKEAENASPTAQGRGHPARKKEGILWALSKPIATVGGADAPKAASKTTNWHESWVVLSGSGHLGEYSHWKDTKGMMLQPSQPLIDLRFATVRETRALERRFTFEVVTRENRHLYQASTEKDMKEWMAALGFAIECLINGTSSVRQIEKVARHPMMTDSEAGDPQEEFGARQVFEKQIQASGLGFQKAFSQSLTDLSSPGRLFTKPSQQAGMYSDISSRKRTKAVLPSKHHQIAASETGHSEPKIRTKRESLDLAQMRNGSEAMGVSRSMLGHERGISNTTPVSGYIAAKNLAPDPYLSRSIDCVRSPSASSMDFDTDYDRRIEAMINGSYGASDSAPSSCFEAGRSDHLDFPDRSAMAASMARLPSRATASTHKEDEYLSASVGMGRVDSTKYSRASEILAIAKQEGNRFCADCRRPDPRWASWSLNGEPRCIFLCISCSGVHRGLGVSVSKVRSVDLDDWTETQLNSAREWGNARVNAIYEAGKPSHVTVANLGGVHSQRFWQAKYVDKAWLE